MRFRPISPELLVAELAESITTCRRDGWLRVAVDGAPAARPWELADALMEPIRVLGRPTLRISAGDFLRAASLRLEHGRHDPDSFYSDWLDEGGLQREVLAPLADGGSGRVLPALWDASRDRATRSSYVNLPAGGVLLLDGALLLGRGLAIDHSVHLALSEPALRRRTPEGEHWTLPAYERYAVEVDPLRTVDTAVRVDDSEHPALRQPCLR
ncbi:MAG: uridine kinase [Sciscionella sp.]